jgi:hypothetical protein
MPIETHLLEGYDLEPTDTGVTGRGKSAVHRPVDRGAEENTSYHAGCL